MNLKINDWNIRITRDRSNGVYNATGRNEITGVDLPHTACADKDFLIQRIEAITVGLDSLTHA